MDGDDRGDESQTQAETSVVGSVIEPGEGLKQAVDLLGCDPGDEVITSPLTFSSDVAPLVRSGIVPAFVDVEPDTFQIDVDGIEAMIGPRTKAILTPNLVGNCPDWDRIRAIADAHGLLVVEDSCDVLNSYLRRSRTGTRSHISVTSFARTHAMTAAGNGGLIAVDDDEWFDQTSRRYAYQPDGEVRSISLAGKKKIAFERDVEGRHTRGTAGVASHAHFHASDQIPVGADDANALARIEEPQIGTFADRHGCADRKNARKRDVEIGDDAER